MQYGVPIILFATLRNLAFDGEMPAGIEGGGGGIEEEEGRASHTQWTEYSIVCAHGSEGRTIVLQKRPPSQEKQSQRI